MSKTITGGHAGTQCECGYDVIGDIHGHADALRRWLTKLGYSEDASGVFRHTSRTIIFLGDFIDRGPQQSEVLAIVRRMCDGGTAQAVMGNHEFNAIGWSIPDGLGDYLRSHTDQNAHQHAEFLREFPQGSREYADAISWFRQLPLWIEHPGLCVIHACWHEPSRALLAEILDEHHCFRDHGLEEAFRRGSEAYRTVEILLKGPEQSLPRDCQFVDKDGRSRSEVRLRWWDINATTFRLAATGFEDRGDELPDLELPCDFRYLEGLP
jgi:hypothetical protein